MYCKCCRKKLVKSIAYKFNTYTNPTALDFSIGFQHWISALDFMHWFYVMPMHIGLRTAVKFVVKSIGVNCCGIEKCLFIPILYSNVIAAWMAWEYWKMHANDSSCIADKALILCNAFHSPSCSIGWNALLGIRAMSAMQLSSFACIFQYSRVHAALRQYSLANFAVIAHYSMRER